MNITPELKNLLEKEIPILTAEIKALYQEFDNKFKLKGAKIPITFGYEEDLLGAYKNATPQEDEHFHFSLLFIGYCLKNQLSKSDRLDLYKHEYAHYMQYNMDIPKEYTFSPGIHGSAWKYCCSLVGAAPTPYYQVGESLKAHDYDAALKNPWKDKSYTIRDRYQQEKAYRDKKNEVVLYEIGEVVSHPKFGQGTIVGIRKQPGAIRLQIAFSSGEKMIDQQWLSKTKYKASR